MGAVEEIKERLDIVEMIQSYVPLKKAGRNYQGLCPFHAEKTPSFVVFPETGTWHCFGACATGGDILTFVMKRENLSFGEALQMLARRAGIELEPRSPQAAEAERRQDLLREINQAAATYYHHLLLESDEAARARSYLEKRGLEAATLERFQLGYALDLWDGLVRYLTNKSYALADLVEAGLVVEREDRSGHYDRFRGRIMFPIRDPQGRTIGFGARAMGDAQPKYMNSPQTSLFDKSSVLFGLDQARAGIRTAGEAVIVEGYMDVLMAHQFGINNVVAQMGTALTEEQLKLLKRHTQRFVLALDSDAAGDQATLRGLDVARQVMDRDVVPVITPRGLIRYEERLAADIRIVSLPPGLDPDEVIRDNPARWAELIGRASPVMDYYFQALTAGLELGTARGKAEAVRLLGPRVAEVSDRVQRTHYLQMLARMVQVDEKALWQQIRQSRAGVRPAPGRPAPAPAAEAARLTLDLEAHCLSFALYYPALLQEVDDVLLACDEPAFGAEDLRGAEEKAILESWRRWLAGGGSPLAQGEFYDTLEEILQARVNALIQARVAQPPAPDDLLRDKVLDAFTELRLRGLRRQVREMRFLQEDAQAAADREAHRRYGKLIVDLSLRIRRLEQSRDGRSVSGRRRNEDALVRVPYGVE
ncbi:MAG TPA: DNA primase [Anaerolineae bacterium]|nr:DNA primase [Anaerolineae bacterium]